MSDPLIDALRDLVAAWDKQPEGNHSSNRVAAWLLGDMKPTVDAARAALKNAAP